MKKEITVNLKDGVRYPLNGNMEEGFAIKIFSPSHAQIEGVCVLDEAMGIMARESMKTITEDDRNKSKDDDSEMTGSDLIEALKVFLPAKKMQGCYTSLSWLLTNGKKAEIDGVSVNQSIVNSLSIRDIKTILGEYIVNFIISSPAKKEEE